MTCPRCGEAGPDGARECARCGVIFEKLAALARRPVPESRPVESASAAAPLEDEEEETGPAIGPAGLRAGAVGLGLALLVLWLSFPRFLLSHLAILVHEIGHTLAGWLFGYPTLPAFDFTYGGGFAFAGERQPLLALLVFTAIAALAWRVRERRRLALALAVVSVLYAAAAATEFHHIIITAMGPLGEVLFAAILLYRGLTGSAVRVAVERPLYAMCGWFVFLGGLARSVSLATSELAREEYSEAKGGMPMDFEILAWDLLKTDLARVAALFAAVFLGAAALTILYARYRREIGAVARRALLA